MYFSLSVRNRRFYSVDEFFRFLNPSDSVYDIDVKASLTDIYHALFCLFVYFPPGAVTGMQLGERTSQGPRFGFGWSFLGGFDGGEGFPPQSSVSSIYPLSSPAECSNALLVSIINRKSRHGD